MYDKEIKEATIGKELCFREPSRECLEAIGHENRPSLHMFGEGNVTGVYDWGRYMCENKELWHLLYDVGDMGHLHRKDMAKSADLGVLSLRLSTHRCFLFMIFMMPSLPWDESV